MISLLLLRGFEVLHRCWNAAKECISKLMRLPKDGVYFAFNKGQMPTGPIRTGQNIGLVHPLLLPISAQHPLNTVGPGYLGQMAEIRLDGQRRIEASWEATSCVSRVSLCSTPAPSYLAKLSS